MSTPEKDSLIDKILENVSHDPSLTDRGLGALASRWYEGVGAQETVRGKQAYTGAFAQSLVPEGATPEAILRGDYGEEAKTAFLQGALMAVDQGMLARLGLSPESPSE